MMTASLQRFRGAILCACVLGAAYPTYGQNRDSEAADTIAVRQKETVPLQVQTPYPTLIHLAVEWLIEGDDNLNGQVTVRFRKVGDTAWREGLPLRRVPADRYELRNRGPRGQPQPDPPLPPIRVFEWANKHSGSLFGLMPDTEYEIALTLHDPDGGDAEKTVRARTRPVPRAMADAPVRPVSPSTIASVQPRPGDILLLALGNYGAFEATLNGEPGRPVVYRSEDGKAMFTSFSLKNRRHVFVEGITVENPERRGTGIQLLGAEECAVRYCTVRASYGIRASRPPGARNCYVADNVVEGPSVWISEAMGARGDNLGEGIQLTGPGNVICYNYLHGFRDCISTMESQNVEDQICVDIYHNDIYLGADDGIEADYCYNNCRIIRNRLTNCFVGVSSQPGLGGPVYFIRNAMYNLTYVPFKFHNRSTGNVALHNTAIKVGDAMACFTRATFDFGYFRNNLCIGGPTGGVKWGGYGAGDGRVAQMRAPGPHTTFDYDALGSHGLPFRGRIGDQVFESVEEMRKGPHEQHGIQVDMDVFNNVEFPDPPVPERKPADLRPRPGSAVVDVALRLPNINDGYLGSGPDIGAFEADQPLPHYGPRPPGVDEGTGVKHGE